MSSALKRENRKEERIACAHPVDLGGVRRGITRDISASGMYFKTGASYAPGNRINFTVELDSLGGKLMLKCDAEVARIEPRDSEVGVAVRLVESLMVPGS